MKRRNLESKRRIFFRSTAWTSEADMLLDEVFWYMPNSNEAVILQSALHALIDRLEQKFEEEPEKRDKKVVANLLENKVYELRNGELIKKEEGNVPSSTQKS